MEAIAIDIEFYVLSCLRAASEIFGGRHMEMTRVTMTDDVAAGKVPRGRIFVFLTLARYGRIPRGMISSEIAKPTFHVEK